MFFNFKKTVIWGLTVASTMLRTPFVSFNVKIPELAKKVGKIAEDGSITDDELADILDYIKDAIK